MLLIVFPAVVTFMYYVGFITLTKLKIKQPESGIKIHFLRIISGFVSLAVFTLFLLLCKWIVVPAQPEI